MHVYICSSCGVSAHPFVYQGQGFYFTLRCAHEHTTFDENRPADLSKRSVRPSPQLREKLCVAKAKAKSPYLRQTDRQNDMVSYTTRRNGTVFNIYRYARFERIKQLAQKNQKWYLIPLKYQYHSQSCNQK